MSNWLTKKLREVLDYEQPGKYIVGSKNYSDEYKTPVLTAGKTFILGNTAETDNIFPADKLPVIIFDDFTTAMKFVDFPFKVKSSAMKILHAKKGVADIRYLFYVMQTTEVNHHTHKRYWISQYSNIEIPLPPLSEQKKIVAKLVYLLGKIKEAKKLRAEAQEATQNILPAALYKIFSEKRSAWPELSIAEIATDIQSGFACSKTNEVSDGVIHLRTHNIDLSGELNLDKTVKIPKNLVEEKAYGLEAGDIIFNNTNSTELVGKTILIRDRLSYAFSNHLTRMRFDNNRVLPGWILYIFQKLWREKYFENICTRWVGQSGVNKGSLSKIKILLPPLPEQKKIVAYLDSLSQKVQSLQRAQSETAEQLEELEQSILHQAFSGKFVL